MSFVSFAVRRAGFALPTSRRTFGTSRIAWQVATQPNASAAQPEILAKLKTELKVAMKARNTMASTVIRSVLAEITNLEKTKAGSPASEPAVYGLIRKAAAKRTEAATQFRAASRTDLAEKEESEVDLLRTFLPLPLTNDEIERRLSEAVASVVVSSSSAQVGAPGAKGGVNVNAIVGKSLKAFWANVPAANAGEIGNEELTKRLKVMVEEQLR